MGITQQLAREVADARYEDIPPAAIARIRDGILDDVGVAFLGYPMAGKHLIEYARDVGGTPESTVIADGARVSCMVAAGVNSQLASDSDFEETGPGGHSLSNIAQAALAVGERLGASGRDVITAVAVAYDINSRFHRAAFPLELIRGEMPPRDTSFPGSSRHRALSVAIAAGKLLGLDAAQLDHAMGIAWYFGPQPSATYIQERRSLELGAGHWGVLAAFMARKGMEGPVDSIEIGGRHDLDRLVSSPSPYYYPANEMHLKPWISSRGTQPAIQSTLEIVKEEGIALEDIEEIRFKAKRLYFQHPFDNPEPRGYRDAVYSVQWAFAMALMGYEAGLEWLAEERFKDPACLAVATKVKLEELPRATEIWESGVRYTNEAPTEVEVVAKGRRYSRAKTYGEVLGSSLNPMPKELLERKFRTQVAPCWGRRRAESWLPRWPAWKSRTM